MCSKSKLKIILSEIRKEAKNIFGDKLVDVILYGSYARGDYDNESDIDVMVKVNIPQVDFMKQRFQLSDICADLGLENDIVISTHVQDNFRFEQYKDCLPFYQNVSKEGIVIDE